MLSVISLSGKQYKVKSGDIVKTDKVVAEVGSRISVKPLLSIDGEAIVDADKCTEVNLEVLEHRKDKKVIVFKKKRRQNYRRKHGHRQHITVLKVQ
jgi:large subunit ribosomal protein L21